VPAADVAALLTSVERALARAVSVAIGHPSRKPGRKEMVVARASHVVLKAIDPGSITPVLELPSADIDADSPQQVIATDVADLSEIAAEQLIDILDGEIDGHPYVLEALASLGKTMGIGRRYSVMEFDVVSGSIPRRRADLNPEVLERLSLRVAADRAAAKQGMLIGTLVEADFEAFTARLRSPEGQSVAVSFDPSLDDQIHEALREPTTVEGWITYDPSNQTARTINLRRVMRGKQIALNIDARAFQSRKSFSQLQREQGLSGIFDVAELHDPEATAEELETYEAALRALYGS